MSSDARLIGMIAFDVPEDILDLAQGPYFPLSQGLIQFGKGAGLEELKAAWPRLEKQVRLVGPQ